MARRLDGLGFVPIALGTVLGLITLSTNSTVVDPPRALAATPLEIVGHLGGAPHDVVLRDGHAYLATGYNFEVWDLTEPARPVRVGELPRAGYVSSSGPGVHDAGVRVRLDGARAYLLDRNMVHVVDIADPAAPRVLGVVRFFVGIADMWPLGDTLYLAVYDPGLGLVTVDISDPAVPKQTAYTHDGSYERLVLVGGLLFAAGDLADDGSGPRGVRAFDLSLPTQPRAVAETEAVRLAAYDLAVSGTHVFAPWNNGLFVYDFGDPQNLRRVAHFATTRPVDTVDVADGRAYIAHAGRVEVLDVADPTQPRSLGSVAVEPWGGNGGEASIAVAAGRVVVTQRATGIIRVLDVADAGQMRELARLDSPLPGCSLMAVRDGHAFVVSRGGLTVVDVATPASPVVIGSYAFPDGQSGWSIGDLAVRRTSLYLLVNREGGTDRTDAWYHEMRVLDVSNAAAPRESAVVDLGEGHGGGLEVRGGFAYVAAYSSLQAPTTRRRLEVVDLGAPAGPRRVGMAEITGVTPGGGGYPELALAGRHVLLRVSGGVAVIDVADPAAPVLTSRFASANLIPNAVVASDAHGYLAYRVNTESFGWYLGAVDLADALAPRMVRTFRLNAVASNLALSANHLFAGTTAGVQMYNHIPPERLGRAKSVSLPAEVDMIALRDGHAYVADRDAGLFILYTGDADLPDMEPPPLAPSPTPTAGPPTATPVPGAPGPVARVCPQIAARVPTSVLSAALANPERVQGWNQLENPSIPPGPFNRRRIWLTIRSVDVPFDALFNPVLYRASCQ